MNKKPKSPSSQPAETVSFEKFIQDLHERSDHIALPDINIAQWPTNVCFSDDISDPKCFNDRFIETDFEKDHSSIVMRFCVLVHNILFFIILIDFFLDMKNSEISLFLNIFSIVIFYMFFLLPLGSFFWIFSQGAQSPPIRINRQAQLIHIAYDEKTALHLKWRDVKPFTKIGQTLSGSYRLRLYFPQPRWEQPQPPSLKWLSRIYSRPFDLNADFSRTDGCNISSNLDRLEFIRRYMEHGLEAIQPDEYMQRMGLVRKPSGFSGETINPDWWDLYVARPFERLLYWFAMGPLIDKWVERKKAAYRWPEEVERLCAPGADVSAWDTRPVTSRKDIFYRHAGDRGYELVDAQGRRI